MLSSEAEWKSVFGVQLNWAGMAPIWVQNPKQHGLLEYMYMHVSPSRETVCMQLDCRFMRLTAKLRSRNLGSHKTLLSEVLGEDNWLLSLPYGDEKHNHVPLNCFCLAISQHSTDPN